MCNACRRRHLATALAAFLAASLTHSCYAATYHVAPDGTPEGDGTREKPFSVQHASRTLELKPGDQVVFLDGVYDMTVPKSTIDLKAVGTAKAPITIRAENRHQAILDGGTPITGWEPEGKGVRKVPLKAAPRNLLVNGEGIISAGNKWRRDPRLQRQRHRQPAEHRRRE